MTDQEIVSLFLGRSEQAISELNRKYGRQILRVAEHVLRDPEDAEECAGDTCLRLTGTPTDPEAQEKLLTIRADGLEFFGTGCMGIGQDGGFLAEFEQGRGEVGDSLTVTFLDWDKQPVRTVTFVKK